MKKKSLLQLGITPEMDPEVKRITILSNAVYSLVGVLLLLYIVISIPRYFKIDSLSFAGMVPFLIVAMTSICLYLNYRMQFKLSKFIFIIGWIGMVTIVPYTLYGTTNQDYILHPLYCIITSVMVHLLFSYQRERILYLLLLAIIWLLILFSIEFISLFKVPESNSLLFRNGFFGWRILMFMFAAFFNVSLIYVLYYNHRFYSKLQLQKEKINNQNQVLRKMTAQLEGTVEERTQSLLKQNETLSEYSFFNSHILRAPVSRVLGLLNLLSMNIDKKEEAKVKQLLTVSMNEIDQVIKLMNKKLGDTHYDKEE